MNFRDSKGGWKTKTLFLEMLGVEDRKKWNPPYTLHEVDVEKHGKVYKSLYKLWMESADEFDFVTTHLGGTQHFEKMCKSIWFGQGHRAHRGIEAWRADMRARDESTAKKALLLAVSEGSVPAANTLYKDSKAPAETKRGRFIKEEAKKEAVKKAEDKDFLEDAAIRLNVVPIRD